MDSRDAAGSGHGRCPAADQTNRRRRARRSSLRPDWGQCPSPESAQARARPPCRSRRPRARVGARPECAQRRKANSSSVLSSILWNVTALRTADACHRGEIAMRLAAVIIVDANIVAQGIGEARLPIARVIFRIVDGDDVLELRWAYLADALDGAQFIGMGGAGGVNERLFVKAGRLDYQRVALEMSDRVAIVERPRLQFVVARH